MKFLKFVYGLQMFANHVNVTTDTTATTGNDLSAEMKTFYDMTLIDEAQANLVHDQFGQKKPIPKNGGKTIEFRKFAPLAKALTPLTEGVTPDGSVLNVSAITATVSQYGDYITQSDVLELTALDNTILEATKLLGRQAGMTLDTVTRNVLQASANVSYASKWSGTTEVAVDEREDLDDTAVLKVDTVNQVVAKLKSINAPTINGDYVSIIHPLNAYELKRDPDWIAAHVYANPDNIYTGEIGKIGGVRFVESSEALIIAPDEISDGYSRLHVVYGGASSSATSIKVTEILTAKATCSIPCYINGVENTITKIEASTYTDANSQSVACTKLTVTALSANVSAGAIVCGQNAAKGGQAVFSTLFIAEGAYGITEVTGGGLQTIVKQKGSAGTADPLDQRSSVGWKAIKTAELLIPDYLVRVESVSPRFSATAKSN